MTIRIGSATRRRFLATSTAATALTAIGGIARPFISRAGERPVITHGVQSGDVSIDSGVVWARADRPSRMLVEIATTDSFKDIRNTTYVDALPETGALAVVDGDGALAAGDRAGQCDFGATNGTSLLIRNYTGESGGVDLGESVARREQNQ